MDDLALIDQIVEPVRKLILGIAHSLVDSPEDVRVTTREGLTSTILTLTVGLGDLGKVIGKQGRTARSIRTILSAAGMKIQHRFELDIAEACPPMPAKIML